MPNIPQWYQWSQITGKNLHNSHTCINHNKHYFVTHATTLLARIRPEISTWVRVFPFSQSFCFSDVKVPCRMFCVTFYLHVLHHLHKLVFKCVCFVVTYVLARYYVYHWVHFFWRSYKLKHNYKRDYLFIYMHAYIHWSTEQELQNECQTCKANYSNYSIASKFIFDILM